jgi:hypothetical protein
MNAQRTNGELCLISERQSPARGRYFQVERMVTPETSAQWHAVYRADEPGVSFSVARQTAKTIAGWNRAATARVHP